MNKTIKRIATRVIISSIALLSLVGVIGLSTNYADASVRVHGYTTKRGTYVQSYYRSNYNYKKYDNYSSKGNYNPYTGKKGYKNW